MAANEDSFCPVAEHPRGNCRDPQGNRPIPENESGPLENYVTESISRQPIRNATRTSVTLAGTSRCGANTAPRDRYATANPIDPTKVGIGGIRRLLRDGDLGVARPETQPRRSSRSGMNPTDPYRVHSSQRTSSVDSEPLHSPPRLDRPSWLRPHWRA